MSDQVTIRAMDRGHRSIRTSEARVLLYTPADEPALLRAFAVDGPVRLTVNAGVVTRVEEVRP